MTEIIVRYGCDGCNTLYQNENDLCRVEIRMPVGGRGEPITSIPRTALYCADCWEERRPKNKYPGVGVPGVHYVD